MRKMIIQEKDKDIIIDYIYLNLMHKTLEHDKKAINFSQIKIKEPYLEMLDGKIKQVKQELDHIKREMKKHGIRVFDMKVKDDLFVEWPYLVRGYYGSQEIWIDAIKLQLKKRLSRLLQ
jgi:hypothetical protein